MTDKGNIFQPGVVLHEVIAGTLKAKGSSFDAWCVENEINRSTARQATYGQSGGDRGKAILEIAGTRAHARRGRASYGRGLW